MRIGLITTFHKRPELTQVFIDYWTGLQTSHTFVYSAAYSADDQAIRPALKHAEKAGWILTEAPNDPLSDKWNAALQAVKRRKLDAVLVVGSDDFMTPALIDLLARDLEAGQPWSVPTVCDFYDQTTDAYAVCQVKELGAGRLFSIDLIKRLDYFLWTPGRHRATDSAMDGRLHSFGERGRALTVPQPPEARILDVKTDVNRMPFKMMVYNLHGQAANAAMLEMYFPGVADRLRKKKPTPAP